MVIALRLGPRNDFVAGRIRAVERKYTLSRHCFNFTVLRAIRTRGIRPSAKLAVSKKRKTAAGINGAAVPTAAPTNPIRRLGHYRQSIHWAVRLVILLGISTFGLCPPMRATMQSSDDGSVRAAREGCLLVGPQIFFRCCWNYPIRSR